jgi:hypothetical protein
VPKIRASIQYLTGIPYFPRFPISILKMSYVRADPNHSGFADLSLALGIAIFSKSTAHGHFPEYLRIRLIQHSLPCEIMFAFI